ncbi:heat shock 90C isoform B [Chlorella sorokiniana]|uniref:Heat shock 90C isoform B n=1 Tax=Chlorella sorokiniana TaxID=3076 RepID=A0A2P6TCG6_CHLSO|nr:heat shock 90C isoform B [Chlorella sorokiniana]|eukprot:PRW20326.1 heat shock 90C isoform B [Chlorella sorokiniana]
MVQCLASSTARSAVAAGAARHATGSAAAPMRALSGRPAAAAAGAARAAAAARLLRGETARQQRLAICAAAAATEAETFQYQAEVDRLMDLIVNSLYSNRDVFLRELVSNASDALDKIRLLAVQDAKEYETGTDLEIRIKADKDAKTIIIEDSGVGLTREELVNTLGTIAKSGTAKFMEAMKEKHDANLIGQFGVGFYSAFLVADKVTVQTKSNKDAKQWEWESAAGAHSYTIREDAAGDIERGTRITFLLPDALEFADAGKLQSLIKQYSEFISFPIKLWVTTSNPEQVVDEEATAKAQEEADKKAAEEGKEAEKVAPVMKTEWKDAQEWKVQNDNKPLWVRSPKDVSKDEYDAFFKTTFREFVEPLAVAHFNVEGTIEFSSMLFVPGMAPFDQDRQMGKSRNIRLYVKRVFISDEFDEDLMPRYLSFIKGVVDSADLPLNVSREILQENRVVRLIRRQLIKRSLDMIQEIADREDKKDYEAFWESFGRFVKLGCIEDGDNRKALAPLLRFTSSACKAEEGLTSLADYLARKKEGQTQIYYLAADSRAACEASPYVEALTSKGYEVLYLTEPIDEVAVQNLQEYEGMQLADVSREDLQLDDTEEDKKALEAATAELKPLTDYMQKVLGDKVEKVTVTNRLTDSPAVVVASKFGWSANMERIMRAQAMGDARAAEYMRGRRNMEINPPHPIIQALKGKVELESREAKEQVQLLFEAALLAGGFMIESPRDFAARIYSLMEGSSSGAGSSGSSSGGSSGSGAAPTALLAAYGASTGQADRQPRRRLAAISDNTECQQAALYIIPALPNVRDTATFKLVRATYIATVKALAPASTISDVIPTLTEPNPIKGGISVHTTILFSGSCEAGKAAARALHVKLLGDVRPMFYVPAPRAKSLFGDVYMITVGFPYLADATGAKLNAPAAPAGTDLAAQFSITWEDVPPSKIGELQSAAFKAAILKQLPAGAGVYFTTMITEGVSYRFGNYWRACAAPVSPTVAKSAGKTSQGGAVWPPGQPATTKAGRLVFNTNIHGTVFNTAAGKATLSQFMQQLRSSTAAVFPPRTFGRMALEPGYGLRLVNGPTFPCTCECDRAAAPLTLAQAFGPNSATATASGASNITWVRWQFSATPASGAAVTQEADAPLVWWYNLAADTSYTISVVGTTAAGKQVPGANTLPIRTPKAGAPTVAAATPTGATQAAVRLTPPTNGQKVSLYIVKLCLQAQPTKFVQKSSTSIQMAFSGLTAGATYAVSATAKIGSTVVPASNTLPLVMPAPGAPILPTALATGARTGAATAAPPGSASISKYVFTADPPSGAPNATSTVTDPLKGSFSGLRPATQYDVTVVGLNGATPTRPSNTLSFVTPAANAPLNTGTPRSPTQVLVKVVPPTIPPINGGSWVTFAVTLCPIAGPQSACVTKRVGGANRRLLSAPDAVPFNAVPDTTWSTAKRVATIRSAPAAFTTLPWPAPTIYTPVVGTQGTKFSVQARAVKGAIISAPSNTERFTTLVQDPPTVVSTVSIGYSAVLACVQLPTLGGPWANGFQCQSCYKGSCKQAPLCPLEPTRRRLLAPGCRDSVGCNLGTLDSSTPYTVSCVALTAASVPSPVSNSVALVIQQPPAPLVTPVASNPVLLECSPSPGGPWSSCNMQLCEGSAPGRRRLQDGCTPIDASCTFANGGTGPCTVDLTGKVKQNVPYNIISVSVMADGVRQSLTGNQAPYVLQWFPPPTVTAINTGGQSYNVSISPDVEVPLLSYPANGWTYYGIATFVYANASTQIFTCTAKNSGGVPQPVVCPVTMLVTDVAVSFSAMAFQGNSNAPPQDTDLRSFPAVPYTAPAIVSAQASGGTSGSVCVRPALQLGIFSSFNCTACPNGVCTGQQPQSCQPVRKRSLLGGAACDEFSLQCYLNGLQPGTFYQVTCVGIPSTGPTTRCAAGLPRKQAAASGRCPRLAPLRAAPPPERHTDPHDLLNVDGAPLLSDPGDLGRVAEVAEWVLDEYEQLSELRAPKARAKARPARPHKSGGDPRKMLNVDEEPLASDPGDLGRVAEGVLEKFERLDKLK